MKAAFIRQTGSVDQIEVGQLDVPAIAPGQVRIGVRAASVNPIDTYIRSGIVAMDLPVPFVLGCDAAGVVEEVGVGVKRFQIGDRVWTTNQGLLGRQGTFAQQIAVDEEWAFHLPDEVSFEGAAACALTGITSHLGLFREAQLQPGESVLVIGGSGGVGSMVVQMAIASGARVIATAGSNAKADFLRTLGVDEVILYKNESIAERTKSLVPGGVNVFWETRREPDFTMAVDLMAPRGRMILMAGRDATPAFPVGPFYVKECSVHGFVMFKATPIEMRAAADEVSRWMADGKIVANIGARFSLDETARAHELQELATLHDSDKLSGKIVIDLS